MGWRDRAGDYAGKVEVSTNEIRETGRAGGIGPRIGEILGVGVLGYWGIGVLGPI